VAYTPVLTIPLRALRAVQGKVVELTLADAAAGWRAEACMFVLPSSSLVEGLQELLLGWVGQ
jgi:hypothetical protein